MSIRRTINTSLLGLAILTSTYLPASASEVDAETRTCTTTTTTTTTTSGGTTTTTTTTTTTCTTTP